MIGLFASCKRRGCLRNVPPLASKQRLRLASARQHVFEARAAQRLDTLNDEAARFADAAAAAGGAAAPAFEEGELVSLTPLALSALAAGAAREAQAALDALVAEPADEKTLTAAAALRAQLAARRPRLASRGVPVAVLTGDESAEAAAWSTAAFSAAPRAARAARRSAAPPTRDARARQLLGTLHVGARWCFSQATTSRAAPLMRALDDEHAQLLGAAPIRSAVRAAVAEIDEFAFRPYVRTRHAPPGGSRGHLLELASVAPLLSFMA